MHPAGGVHLGDGFGHAGENVGDVAYQLRATILERQTFAELHEQVKFSNGDKAANPPDTVNLPNNRVVEVLGDVKLVDGLFEESLVLTGSLDDPLQRKKFAALAMANLPDRTTSTRAKLLDNLVRGHLQ
jgi:hypothetical protein